MESKKYRKCNSVFKKFLSEENSYRYTILQNVEDTVDIMGTYNSLDKQGIDKYITGIRNVVKTALNPGASLNSGLNLSSRSCYQTI